MNWNTFWEAIKEPLREIVLAILPGLLAYFQTINATWAVILYIALRALDSWLHENAKQQPSTTQNTGVLGVKGLTGF